MGLQFHQVVRSSTPFFTLLLSFFFLNARPTRQKLISLLPVITGVGLATYGDYYYTPSGFILTLFGTFLAALKSVVINILQAPPTSLTDSASPLSSKNSPYSRSSSEKNHSTVLLSPTTVSFPSPISSSSSSQTSSGPASSSDTSNHTGSTFLFTIPKLRLSPLQLLHLLSPLSFIQCMFLAICFGEIKKFATQLSTNGSGVETTGYRGPFDLSSLEVSGLLKLSMNASLAFALNVVSFYTNRRVGPLGMSVIANVKQVLTVLSSAIIFDLKITMMNALGIGLTLAGGAWYVSMDLGL